jgi:pSer/pThr/pTyr-binding forkhead associated (FHA) protein
VFIGRAPECDVVASHDDISRRHALLYRERGLIWVHDLSSANGTSIDGVKARDVPLPLSNGSVITLASHRYRFVEKTSA